jgi:hypothetical protein
MAKGYREGSKMSRTLDILAGKGIDCIKIGDHRVHGNAYAIFFPINMLEDSNFIDELFRSDSTFLTEEEMEIGVETMMGYEIRNFNKKFKTKDNEAYRVLKIYYPCFKV